MNLRHNIRAHDVLFLPVAAFDKNVGRDGFYQFIRSVFGKQCNKINHFQACQDLCPKQIPLQLQLAYVRRKMARAAFEKGTARA